jgi:hypothetical protein
LASTSPGGGRHPGGPNLSFLLRRPDEDFVDRHVAGPGDDVDDSVGDVFGLEYLNVFEAGGGLLPDLIPQVTLKQRGDRSPLLSPGTRSLPPGTLVSCGMWQGCQRNDRIRPLLRLAGGDLGLDPGRIGAARFRGNRGTAGGIKGEGEPSEKDLAGRRNRRKRVVART